MTSPPILCLFMTERIWEAVRSVSTTMWNNLHHRQGEESETRERPMVTNAHSKPPSQILKPVVPYWILVEPPKLVKHFVRILFSVVHGLSLRACSNLLHQKRNKLFDRETISHKRNTIRLPQNNFCNSNRNLLHENLRDQVEGPPGLNVSKDA